MTLDDPFIIGEKIYNTGDLAKWRKDGEIEFIGRADFQVKIRGYRIELPEIEKELAACTGVNESAIVVDKDSMGYNRLVAYYTSSTEVDQKQIRQEMRKSLPAYMVPDIFMRLVEMPLTPNCKINRKALPKITDIVQEDKPSEIPENPIQLQILKIWTEVLNNNNIGINDVFFELGGNSLSLVVMHSRLDEIYPGKVNIAEIFSNPTILHLSKLIESPKEYILPAFTNNPESVLNYTFPQDYSNAFTALAESLNTEKWTVFSAAFAFTLSRATQCQKVFFYLYKDLLYHEVSIDMAKISNFNSIISEIEKCTIATNKSNNSLPEYPLAGITKNGKNSISALLMVDEVKGSDIFDFKFSCITCKNQFSISASFNSIKLNSKRMEHFFKNYVKTVRQLLQKINATTN